MIHLHPSSLRFFLFFYLVNQPSSLSYFSSLLRASAPASHQHQHLGSARGVKAQGGGGAYHPPYMCGVCAHVCLFVREPQRPQTFMCLLFIISNNFFPHLLHLSGSFAARSLPPLVLCAIIRSYLFSLSHTTTLQRELS